MKKILRFTGFLLLGILLAMFLVPIIFKDKIIQSVKNALNDQLIAEVDFKDASLSLIRSFPNARLTIDDLQITGVDTFENVPLFNAKEVYLVSDISPLFKKGGKLSIKFVSASDAFINIVQLNEDIANYNITKPTDDTSGFNLVLEGYELNNTRISYLDQTMLMQVTAAGLQHSGSGNLSDAVFELNTKTLIDSLYISYENFTYLNHVNTAADLTFKVDLPGERYAVENGVVRLNKLELSGNALVDFEEQGMMVKTDLKSVGQSFENFVSALPFIENKKEYQAKGSADLSVKADGLYNGEEGLYPSFDVALKLKDGYLKYKSLPYPVSPVNADVQISSKDQKMKDLSVKVPHFDFGINNEKISGELFVDRASTSPYLKGAVKGGIDLNNWKNALHMDGVDQLSGKILADLSYNGKLSDIQQSAYDRIGFDGHFTLKNILYQQKNKPLIQLGSVKLDASPKMLVMRSENIKMGRSVLDLNGEIKDPLKVALKEEQLVGRIQMESDFLDLDEFSSQDEGVSNQTSGSHSFDPENYKASNIDLNLDLKKIRFGQKDYDNVQVAGKLGLNVLDIQKMTATIDKSDLTLQGKVINAYDFVANGQKLSGNITLLSNYLDMNQFMTAEGESSQTGVILLPENVDVRIDADIKRLDYTNYTLSNLTGNVSVADREARLENINTEILGGRIQFEGLYNTAGPKPEYTLKMALDKIRIEDAYNTFVTMKTLAPVSQFIKGFLNTTLIMSGSLTEQMTPEWTDLNAEGFIETIHSALKNLTIMDQIADKLGVEALKKIDITSSKNWFSVKEGTVELKEKTFTVQDIGLRISGTHHIKGAMDYDLFLKIPRSKIRASKAGNQLDKGLGWISGEASKRGISIANGEYIDLKIDVLGNLSNPDLKYTVLGSSGKNMSEQVSGEIKSQMDKAKDSIKQVVTDKRKAMEDTVRARLGSEVEKAKEKIKTEAEKKAEEVVGSVKKEIQKELGSRVDSTLSTVVNDSLKKKAEEIIKSKTGEEVKEIKKKLEEFNPFKKKKTGGNR